MRKMDPHILSWSRSEAPFAGGALEGATLREDLDDDATLYGKNLANSEIVTKGVRPPKPAAKLLERWTGTRRTQELVGRGGMSRPGGSVMEES